LAIGYVVFTWIDGAKPCSFIVEINNHRRIKLAAFNLSNKVVVFVKFCIKVKLFLIII
jgi:hypothetical protein